jgi:hypothetical protein
MVSTLIEAMSVRRSRSMLRAAWKTPNFPPP